MEGIEECNFHDKVGHKNKQCINDRNSVNGSKYQGRNSSSPMTTKPIPCPVYTQQHTSMSSEEQTLYESRLGACGEFKKLMVEERTDVLTQANGCALCLDKTRDHHCNACQSITMLGIFFPRCMVQVDGSVCGANRHYLLHGLRNNFYNYMETREITKLFWEIRPPDIARLCGEVNLLMGMEDAELHPRLYQNMRNCRLVPSIIRTGYLVDGTHDTLNEESVQMAEYIYESHSVNQSGRQGTRPKWVN